MENKKDTNVVLTYIACKTIVSELGLFLAIHGDKFVLRSDSHTNVEITYQCGHIKSMKQYLSGMQCMYHKQLEKEASLKKLIKGD
jgi:hypothetical protein